MRYRASDRISFETGGELAYNRLDSKTLLTFNGQDIALPAANVQVDEERGEAFLRSTTRILPRLTLEVAVRQEGSRIRSRGDVALEKTLWYTKPRLSLSWSPRSNLQVRARFEREVGQLNFADFVAASTVASTGVPVAGNPNLEPQRARVPEGSVEQRLGQAGAIVLTVRRTAIDKVVDRLPVRSPQGTVLADAPGNIGHGTKDELILDATTSLDLLRIHHAQLKVQATLRRTEVHDPLTGQRREISGITPVDWELKQGLPTWRTTWGVDLTGESRLRYYRLTQVETDKTLPFLTLYSEYAVRRV